MTALPEGDSTTARPVRARVRARWRVVTVATLLGVLVAASGAAAVVRDDRRLAELDALGAAAGRATTAVADLAAAVPAARTALDGSAGRVGDEGVRTTLAAALDTALTAARTRGVTVDEVDAATARVASSGAALVDATSAVTTEVASWELACAKAEWSEAGARLAEAISAARGVLDTSAGRVADDAVRRSLADVVESARALMAADPPLEASALSVAATALARAVDSLAAPQAAVTDAVAAWTQAQASFRPDGSSSPRSPGSTAGNSRSWPSASPSPTATDEGQWQTTVTYEDMRLCMDTEGNSWEC